MRTPFMLSLVLGAAPLAAQLPSAPFARDTARITIGEATVTVDHDVLVASDSMLVGRTIPLGAWKLGTRAPAQLVTSGAIMIDDKTIPAGSYSLWVLVGDESATLVVSKDLPTARLAYDRSHDVARIPLTVEHGDTALPRFRTRLGLASRTVSTMVWNYDQAHSQVYSKYRISSEPSVRPDFDLSFEWQHLRWSVPVRVIPAKP